MNVLITGGAGLIGSNLAEHLLHAGHAVIVLDNLSTGRWENIAHLSAFPGFSFIKASVTDGETVFAQIQHCDHVYHLAAPVGVKYIMEHPVLAILDNVRGIDIVLEGCHIYRKKVLVASTSEVYGRSLDLLDPTGKRKLQEDDYRVEGSTVNHRWAYANTKSLDEFLALAYHKEHGMACVIVRFFNTVGPRQLSNYGMVIPNFVEAALRNEPIPIFGDGSQQRSFLHVNDAIRAITMLMDEPSAEGRVFNVGNPFEISMNDLAEKIIAQTGSTAGIRRIPYEQAYGKGFEDMQRRTADITRLKATVPFEIQYNLDMLLADIIAGRRVTHIS